MAFVSGQDGINYVQRLCKANDELGGFANYNLRERFKKVGDEELIDLLVDLL